MTYDDYLETQIKRHTDAPQRWEALYADADMSLPEASTKWQAIEYLNQHVDAVVDLIADIKEAD